MTDAPTPAVISYRKYWVAWLALLIVTLIMVFVGHRPLLVAGMIVKASVIALWFMHLKYERLGLVLSVLLGTFVTGLVLYVLIIPDGMAM